MVKSKITVNSQGRLLDVFIFDGNMHMLKGIQPNYKAFNNPIDNRIIGFFEGTNQNVPPDRLTGFCYYVGTLRETAQRNVGLDVNFYSRYTPIAPEDIKRIIQFAEQPNVPIFTSYDQSKWEAIGKVQRPVNQ